MKRRKAGFIAVQALLVTATIGVASLIAVPRYQGISETAAVTEALALARDIQRRLAHRFEVTGTFPTSNKQAAAVIPSRVAMPEFIRDLRIQPDRSGTTVTIKVFLRDGVVDNPTGEKQQISIAGNKVTGAQVSAHWQCGSSGVPLELLPDDCRG